jgi:hypothetical protein
MPTINGKRVVNFRIPPKEDKKWILYTQKKRFGSYPKEPRQEQ